MKKILGLDLGTNSIGWAVVSGNTINEINKIEGAGSRIIPMSQDVLGKFDSGASVSQTAERTGFRSTRRLRERHLLRRERLHRVLHVLGFLPKHYEECIDFNSRLGKYLTDTEPKIAWKKTDSGDFEFLFVNSYQEMLADFSEYQPQLVANDKKIPYDWTIYYLRKKAITQKIEKEELAWLILNFNQKRGYYQLRGEEEENLKKREEYRALKIVEVIADEPQKGKSDIWYTCKLDNGWEYRRSSKIPLFDWVGITKDFIVSTELNEDGTEMIDKDGKVKRSFRAPSDDDWGLLKKKTEGEIDKSSKTVGTYIYDTLLQAPNQKIKGKLVRTIERKYYRQELMLILNKQRECHPELQDEYLYQQCLKELYFYNEAHQNNLKDGNFTRLFVEDIIFYQRPLKSKKSEISNCPYEYRLFKNGNGVWEKAPIKCVPKSNPWFQELRLWQFIHNLRLIERVKKVDGKLHINADVTSEFLPTEESRVSLFEWLNDRKSIKQDLLLKSYFKIKKEKGSEQLPYRWKYVEDKEYPCNETRGLILDKLKKGKIADDFLTIEKELALWHILYSVEDKEELKKALNTFANKNGLAAEFVDEFAKFPPFSKEYGGYSEKAIKKLLPLMRQGKYWDQNQIDNTVIRNIESILSRLKEINNDEKLIESVSDDDIPKQVLKSFIKTGSAISGLNTFQACYAVYNRHSEASEITQWRTPQDLDDYIKDFRQHSLRNPIVEQIVLETLRTVRDIWKKYGDLSEIHLELGREMKNPATERAKMTAQISEKENTNLRIKALLMELKNHDDVENVRPYSPSQQEILKIYEDGVFCSETDIPDYIVKIRKQSQPTQSELCRYKLWLEQKYKSPYTGEIIPLGRLFTSDYEIEHIIPQSRYFDDSFSNKVICESEVNKLKGNLLGYEFIKKHAGEIVTLNYGRKSVSILTPSAYELFVKNHYAKSPAKSKKLLLEDIPDSFIERQLNDSRYISKYIKGLLSNIVREDNEQEAISKNLVPCTGGITSKLKQEWGLNDIWNRLITPRFERLNLLTNSNQFGQWENKEGKRVFQISIPLELQKGFNKKRIDHRHHALDAIIIACTTRNHVNYLNNAHANKSATENTRLDLKNKLCKKTIVDNKGNYQWQFIKPWETFTQDTYTVLSNIIVSFKQNLRVINKTVNWFQSYKDENGELFLSKEGRPTKRLRKQVKGDNWAIRKSLHKDTVAGHVNLRFKKLVNLSVAIENWEMMVDKGLRTKTKQLINDGYDSKQIKKFFATQNNKWMGKEIAKTEIYFFSDEKECLVASRVALDTSFNSKKIETITDTGIQKILLQQLRKYDEEVNGKIIEHPELAFTPEAIEDMNQNIQELNGGKNHHPIRKVRTFEPKGNKFNVGVAGNKKDKYVEAAKGTNLFFAIYVNDEGTRKFETIPFNIVVERLKQGLPAVPEQNEKGETLLFSLSPNDLVYVPTEDEIELGNIGEIRQERVYKMVSCTERECHFTPCMISMPIVKNTELGSNNKSERSWDGIMIKHYCLKLRIDRLGNQRH